MKETYEQRIRAILADELSLTDAATYPPQDDLQYIGMDSVNCIRLLVALEDTFGIEIPDDRLGLRFVRTIEDIGKLVKEAMSDGQI